MLHNKENIFSRTLNSHAGIIILLFIIFVVTELIINPIGNFPINDDWVYGKVLNTLITNHFIDTRIWGGASMVTHIFYGKVWTNIFGFSFTVLRFSILVTAFFGLVFFYFLLNDFVVKEKQKALVGVLMVWFNPLFVSLANSYMTDVPFVSFVIMGLYFYLKYLEKGKLIFLVLSVIIFLWIIGTRQLSLAMVIGIYSVRVWQTKKIFGAHGFLMGTAIIGLFLFEYWLSHQKQSYISTGYSYLFFGGEFGNTTLWKEFFMNLSKRWIHFLIFTGFVLFPFLIVYLYDFIRNGINKKSILIFSIPFFAAVLIAMRKFPLGNYLYDLGFGPETLFFFPTNKLSSIGFDFIKAISILGSGAIILMGISLILKHKKSLAAQLKKETLIGSIIFAFIFYYIFICFSNALFDRYFLMVTVLSIPIVLKLFPSIFNYKIILCICLILQILFSVFTSKDYLQTNRVKWEAIDYAKTVLMASDDDINLGYEFEDFHLSETNIWFDRWMNEPPNKIVISREKISGYKSAKTFPFIRYIPFKSDTVFIWERD